jgi:hypothetical protein
MFINLTIHNTTITRPEAVRTLILRTPFVGCMTTNAIFLRNVLWLVEESLHEATNKFLFHFQNEGFFFYEFRLADIHSLNFSSHSISSGTSPVLLAAAFEKRGNVRGHLVLLPGKSRLPAPFQRVTNTRILKYMCSKTERICRIPPRYKSDGLPATAS